MRYSLGKLGEALAEGGVFFALVPALVGAVALLLLGASGLAALPVAALLFVFGLQQAKRARQTYREDTCANEPENTGSRARTEKIIAVLDERLASLAQIMERGDSIPAAQADSAQSSQRTLLQELEKLAQQSADLDVLARDAGYIAGQTNLLALNTAIEAARGDGKAGAQAMPGDALRNLSTLTAEYAGNIALLAETLKQAVAATRQAAAASGGQGAAINGDAARQVEGFATELRRENERASNEVASALLALQAQEHDNKLLQHLNTTSRLCFEDLARQIAYYDPLTDLPNRRRFASKLAAALAAARRNAGKVALLHIGLDRFKGVNDTLGYEAGDWLLIQAAERVRYAVRDSDLVAHLCGDEFVVAISGMDSIPHWGRAANHLVEELGKPFDLAGQMVFLSASIGIASYPSDADSADSLQACAGQAMRAAKAGGRNGFQFYSKELSGTAGDKLMLERDLRAGIAGGELELHYQPKVNFADGSLIGCEALVRWNCPHRGTVQPDQFIAIAEESGLIAEIGEWALREACRTACAWNGDGKPVHKVAINLSSRQFQTGDLAHLVGTILEETGCCPEWIELEITESLLLDERGGALQTLQAFRALGISIAIDDFGTGYSALSYLARFPINTLKIDKSFTSQILADGYHAEVVKAIVSIAHSLNQQVVAEGVETPEQAAVLRGYGCHIAQGFLYSKPVAKSAFERLPQWYELKRA